jgi:hypothetical protein
LLCFGANGVAAF